MIMGKKVYKAEFYRETAVCQIVGYNDDYLLVIYVGGALASMLHGECELKPYSEGSYKLEEVTGDLKDFFYNKLPWAIEMIQKRLEIDIEELVMAKEYMEEIQELHGLIPVKPKTMDGMCASLLENGFTLEGSE